jgi:hypothetical protein
MFTIPMIQQEGLDLITPALESTTIEEMQHHIEVFQPRLSLFLDTLMSEQECEEDERARLIIVAWYILTAVHAQGVSEAKPFSDLYDTLIDKWGISSSPELEQVNLASVDEKDYISSSKCLINNLGEEKAMPIIQAATRSIQPELLMSCVYYAITVMNTKSRRNTRVSSN